MKRFLVSLLICFSAAGTVAFAGGNYDIDNSLVFDTETKTKYKEAKFSSYKPRRIFTDDLKFNRNFADQVRKERAAVSNALGLSEEQVKIRVELTRKNSAVLEEKFRILYDENYKLKVLKAEKASKNDIKAQQEKVNNIKKEIKTVVEEENKEFNKILDRQQRSKLRMIQKLQRKAMKESGKEKNYYKSNPKMRPFAMQEKQNFDSVTGELE